MEHWDSRVPVLVRLKGAPELYLRVDQPRGRLTLRAPVVPGVEALPKRLANVTVEILAEGDATYLDISTWVDRSQVTDSYAMLMAISDRIQDAGAEPLEALKETLAVWESILASRHRMDLRTEIGLFGELLVLRALFLVAPDAWAAWRGGLGEEHDFGFAGADVEVKTTSGDRRIHWINGLTQLVATGDTPLWVLSLQITRGGASQGLTLPELINEVIEVAGSGQELVERNLAGSGWDPDQRDLFVDRWRLRGRPLLLAIDEEFPRLTPSLLSGATFDIGSLVHVDYQIDITDRPHSSGSTGTLKKVVERMEVDVDG